MPGEKKTQLGREVTSRSRAQPSAPLCGEPSAEHDSTLGRKGGRHRAHGPGKKKCAESKPYEFPPFPVGFTALFFYGDRVPPYDAFRAPVAVRRCTVASDLRGIYGKCMGNLHHSRPRHPKIKKKDSGLAAPLLIVLCYRFFFLGGDSSQVIGCCYSNGRAQRSTDAVRPYTQRDVRTKRTMMLTEIGTYPHCSLPPSLCCPARSGVVVRVWGSRSPLDCYTKYHFSLGFSIQAPVPPAGPSSRRHPHGRFSTCRRAQIRTTHPPVSISLFDSRISYCTCTCRLPHFPYAAQSPQFCTRPRGARP